MSAEGIARATELAKAAVALLEDKDNVGGFGWSVAFSKTLMELAGHAGQGDVAAKVTAYNAIRARIQGEWDNDDLQKFAHLRVDMLGDIAHIVDKTEHDRRARQEKQ